MAEPPRRRSGSVIEPRQRETEKNGSSAKKGIGVEDLFRKLHLKPADQPLPRSINLTRTGPSAVLPKPVKTQEPQGPIDFFNQYLRTLFTSATATLQETTIHICFDALSTNSLKTSSACIPAKISSLLSENPQKYKVSVEIPQEALGSANDTRFHQFLEEVSPYLVSLRCFPTHPVQKLKNSAKWHFPVLEQLDFTGCSISREVIDSIDCPRLLRLILRKVRGLSAEEIITIPTRLSRVLEIDFKKCPEISSEQIRGALESDCTSLLFFLKMAKKFHHKMLEEICRNSLLEHFGDALRIDFANGDLLFVLSALTLNVETLQKVFHKKVPFQTKLIVDYERKRDPEVQKCIQWLQGLPKPCWLSIQLSRSEDITPETLKMLSGVYELKLPSGKANSREILTIISESLPELQSLDQSGALLETLAGLTLPRLCSLSLSRSQVQNIETLTAQSTLEHVSLAWCENLNEEACYQTLTSCPHIRSIALSGCSWVSEKMVLDLFENCSDLTSVDTRECKQIAPFLQTVWLRDNPFQHHTVVDWNHKHTNQTVKMIAQRASVSTKLSFENCKIFDDHVLPFFCKGNPTSSLTIRDFAIRDALLIEPIKVLSHLQRLKLEGPVGFSGLMQLVEFQNLTSLSLTTDESKVQFGRQDITGIDDGLKCLSESLTRLEKLTLQGFSEVTLAGLSAIVKYCKRLRKMRIRDCQKVSKEALEKLCVDSGIDLEYSTSPYQIKVRPATVEDREKALLDIERELEKFNTFLISCPGINPESLAESKRAITEKQKQIRDIQLQESDLQEANAKLFKVHKEFHEAYPECPDVSKMDAAFLQIYYAKILSLQAASQVASNMTEILVKMKIEAKKELPGLISDLKIEGVGLEEALQRIFDTNLRIELREKEKKDLSKKTVALTIIASNYKHVKPIEDILQSSPECNQGSPFTLLERIKTSATLAKYEFTILFTLEEINLLATLGILEKWVPEALNLDSAVGNGRI